MQNSNKTRPALLWELLQVELSSYPGRLPLAIRMALACTVVIVIIMVFRIPSAALGAYFPLLMPRDSLRSTLRAVGATAVVCIAGTVQVLLGAALFGASPMLHFFWTAANIFLVFYWTSAMTVSSAAVGLGLLTLSQITIWDNALTADARVSLTLYTLLSILVGCAVTAGIELAFSATHPPDLVLSGIRERLSAARELLETYIAEEKPSLLMRHRLMHLARRGTGQLSDLLAHSLYQEPYLSQVATALALSDELAGLCSNLAELEQHPTGDDRQRMRTLVSHLVQAEVHLSREEAPERVELPDVFVISRSMPLLNEIERNVDLILDSFTEGSSKMCLSAGGRTVSGIFVEDAFRGNRHLKFATRGALSAMLCYLAYLSVGWKGLNASIVTCFLTALTSVGLTRQKQLLRLSGVFLGGCILGFGTQRFVLPHIDTVPEFAVVFASSMFLCAWVSTASPRIAYAGLQMALAYDLVNLTGFTLNTSLVSAGAAVFGILLGLAAMWLVYDHLWATSSTTSFRRISIQKLRALRDLCISEAPSTVRLARERERVGRLFEESRAYADSLLFEPYSKDPAERALVQKMIQWQPELRALTLVQFGLMQHLAATGNSSPFPGQALQKTSVVLDSMAATLEGKSVYLPEADFAALLSDIEKVQSRCLPGEEDLRTEMRLTHSLCVLAGDLHYRMPDTCNLVTKNH